MYKVIAKTNVTTDSDTWTRGKEYEVKEYTGYFILTSNQGATRFGEAAKRMILMDFERVS